MGARIHCVYHYGRQDHQIAIGEKSLPLKKPLDMNISQLKAFLWECTKLNFFFLLLFSIVMLLADQVYMIHEHFYGGTLIEFKKDLYMIIGLYKMIWIFFNVIPYWVVRGMNKEG